MDKLSRITMRKVLATIPILPGGAIPMITLLFEVLKVPKVMAIPARVKIAGRIEFESRFKANPKAVAEPIAIPITHRMRGWIMLASRPAMGPVIA